MSIHNSDISLEELKAEKIKRIWTVASILAIITAIELVLAFIWPDSWSRLMLNILFLILTLFKAFYIVGEFMHLKYEVKKLAWSIVAPMILIIWLVVALIKEANSISETIIRFLN